MKKLGALLLALPLLCQGQEKEIRKRVEYLRAHPIFVVQNELREKDERFSPANLAAANASLANLNRNMRNGFDKFWNLSDTIIYLEFSNFQKKKKEQPSALFFEIVSFGEVESNDGQVPVLAFKLTRFNNKYFLNNVAPILLRDSSMVGFATGLRMMMCNITLGTMFNNRDLGNKMVLMDKGEKRNSFAQSYVDLIIKKYKDAIVEVDYPTLLKAILDKDPRFIYLYGGSAFNAEDGTLINLQ